jgi:16S rRNA (uracil1498-N3)-methyltransferase
VVEGLVAPGELVAHPGLVVAALDGVPAHDLPAPAGDEWAVVIGPEGGFGDTELAAFDHPAAAPRLQVGPFVLRAETAAIAAAAALAGRRHRAG